MRNQKGGTKIASADTTKPITKSEPAKPVAEPVTKPETTTAASAPPQPPIVAAANPNLPPPPAKSAPIPPKPVNETEEVTKTLKAWAAAWSAKDVPGYLSFYAIDFKTPGNQPRGEWENARKLRIQAPKTIVVSLDNIRVRPTGTSTALVSFHQNYKSDTLKSMGASKTVVMTRNSGKWQILEERVGS
jgi:ketosteroid isomerase-like protein